VNSLPRIRSVTPYLYRIPLETPVVTSFGTMRARSALFIAIDDTEGHRGAPMHVAHAQRWRSSDQV